MMHKNMTQAEYQQICKKYEQHIYNLQSQLQKLQKPQPPKPTPSTSTTPKSTSSSTFNMSEYLARTTKQREQAKQIQQKAAKLKQKQKLERALLKKMKEKNQILRRSQQFSQGRSYMGGSGILGSQQEGVDGGGGRGEVDMVNTTKSRIYEEAEPVYRIPHPTKNLFSSPQQYSNILSQNEQLQTQKPPNETPSLSLSLSQQIQSLKQQLQTVQKQLQKQKSLRENAQQLVAELTNENNQKDGRIGDLEEELRKSGDVVGKLEFLLEENLRVIRDKDGEIEELEKNNKDAKTKYEQLNTLVQKLQQQLTQSKQPQPQSPNLPSCQKQQSLIFGSSSEHSLPPSISSIHLFHSTQLLQQKLKQIQQKLHLAESEKRSLKESQSSLENVVMCLEEERKLRESLGVENLGLRRELERRVGEVQGLVASKEQLEKKDKQSRQELEKNIQTILQLLQTNPLQSPTLTTLTHHLQSHLLQTTTQTQSLQSQVLHLQQQNTSYQLLNQQLESQIKSHIDLSYHLGQTINKQQIQIEKYEEEVEKYEEKVGELQRKVQEMRDEREAERVEREVQGVEMGRLREEVKSLGEYIAGMNSEMVRSRIKEKQRELERQLTSQQQQEQQQQPQNESKQQEQKDEPQIQPQTQPKQPQNQPENQTKQFQENQPPSQPTIPNLLTQIQTLQQTLLQKQHQIALLTSSLQKQLQLQQQKISILKLENSQLEDNSQNVEIQMDLLHKMVEKLNQEVRDKERARMEVERERDGLRGDLGKCRSEVAEAKQCIAKIQETIKELQAEKQQTTQHLLHVQIQYDLSIVQLKTLQTELQTLSKKLQQKQQSLSQLSTLNTCNQQKITQLQQLLQHRNEELFLANIPKIQDSSEKQSVDSMKIVDKDKEDKEREKEREREREDVEKVLKEIGEYWDGRVREYSRDIGDIVRKFVLEVVQVGVIRDNKKYLELVLKFLDQVFSSAESKYHKLQKYMNSMQQSVNKTPGPQNLQTPQISNSPLTHKKPQIPEHQQKTPKMSVSRSLNILQPSLSPSPTPSPSNKNSNPNLNLNLNLNLNKSQKQDYQASDGKEDGNKKSVLLSEDFNDAFSREDQEEDRMSRRYMRNDGVKESSKSREKDLGASGTFARSTHSMMEELQAQESYKKDMRNLKMKAKQHRRKA